MSDSVWATRNNNKPSRTLTAQVCVLLNFPNHSGITLKTR